ncbi:MAG: hypothetical protein PHN88_14860 [Ignavibacteria bacterium]|nr:hypothetical protein [Ignavibacteria bacterium]
MSVGVCRLLKESDGEKIKYAHSSAVTAWTPINVSGLGVLIPTVSATAAEMAASPIMFYRKGTFMFAIQSAVTIAVKQVIYYDTATDKVTNVSSATTFLLGTSIEAGTATAGYVPVELLPYPFSAGSVSLEHLDSGIKPAYIDIAVGTISAGGTATTETKAVVGVLSTDQLFAEVRTIGGDTTVRILNRTASDGSISVTLSTPMGSGSPKIAYCVKRAAA